MAEANAVDGGLGEVKLAEGLLDALHLNLHSTVELMRAAETWTKYQP